MAYRLVRCTPLTPLSNVHRIRRKEKFVAGKAFIHGCCDRLWGFPSGLGNAMVAGAADVRWGSEVCSGVRIWSDVNKKCSHPMR